LRIAAAVAAEIEPLVASRDIEELDRAARRAQDARWRLIYHDTRKTTDDTHGTAMAEQWILASLELLRGASPVDELLARKRRSAVEAFLRDNLSSESFVQLRRAVMDETHVARAAA